MVPLVVQAQVGDRGPLRGGWPTHPGLCPVHRAFRDERELESRLDFGDRGYRYDASAGLNPSDEYIYDAALRLSLQRSVYTFIDFYRQRTRYRIRERLLRGRGCNRSNASYGGAGNLL
jgi:hypothetical protein